MQAIDHTHGALQRVTVAAPPLLPGCVRVAVAASGVNRADLAQRAGVYPAPPGASPILGLEVSGTIAEVADDVTGWKIGDRVCALLAGGGYAEQVVVPAEHVLAVPDGVDLFEAAAFFEVFATAWLNLVDEGGLGEPGASVLLHAGASGVGTAAIQLARLLGHRSFVTAGSAEKIARCVALGADGGWCRHDGPWLPAVQAWRPGGVEVILDPVGAGYLADNQAALAVGGRLVIIGLLSGRSAPLDLGKLLMRRQRVVGSTLRSRDHATKAALTAALAAHVVPSWGGAVRGIVDRVLPVDEAEAAHAHMAANAGFGCLVLRW